jgi:hypothetical protein
MTDQPVRTVVTDRAGETERPIVAVKLRPLTLVLVRVARVFLMSLVGFLGVSLAGDLQTGLDVLEFGQRLHGAARLAVAPAAMSLIWNAIEMLNRWDVTRPEMRG